ARQLSQAEFTSVGERHQAMNGKRRQVVTTESQQELGATFKALMEGHNNPLKPLGRRHVRHQVLQQFGFGHGISQVWVIKTKVVNFTMNFGVFYTKLSHEPTVGKT